jgi:hypothetical protein
VLICSEMSCRDEFGVRNEFVVFLSFSFVIRPLLERRYFWEIEMRRVQEMEWQ